jgi:hypothetical protein
LRQNLRLPTDANVTGCRAPQRIPEGIGQKTAGQHRQETLSIRMVSVTMSSGGGHPSASVRFETRTLSKLASGAGWFQHTGSVLHL